MTVFSSHGKELGNQDYCQNSVPVKDQKQIGGHTVRARYLYTEVADVDAIENDTGYIKAMHSF
jgi:DUF1680 family protein